MSADRFQLARVDAGDGAGARIVVRHDGRLLPLAGLLDGDDQRPLPVTTTELLVDGERSFARIGAALAARGDAVAPLADDGLRWLPPVDTPRKLVCIGANYRDHIREMGIDPSKRPAHPYSFMVPPSTTLVGDGATVKLPAIAEKIDWEAEVAVVIGTRLHGVSPQEALAGVAAYSVLNDLSARDWTGPNAPKVGIDWVMTKAYDGFKPMGPWLTPAQFVERPDDLAVRSWVNGEPKQDGTTADMLFDTGELLAHLASIMTLEPGDVVATGTPAGVGHGRRPPEYLGAGDRVTVEVAGLGRLETTFA
ncbi:MAG TPA: fumarylacetoacetate hydrolase family protein [Conexibacter sp.]|nr:fumarylacetoacetate hydrolase family protein [Conexibacter sp.]